jgi:hypothetical protein
MGVVYLISAAYLAMAIVGYVWYKKFRRKKVDLHMRSGERFNLN